MQQLRILLGDNGTNFARHFADRLRRRGCICSTHRQSVANFLRSIAAESPDAIIIDISDKSVDHYNLLVAIQKSCDAPVFAVTAAFNPYMEKQLYQAGMSAIWRKPIDDGAALQEIALCVHGATSFAQYRSFTIEMVITEFLQRLGMSPDMAGYRYLQAILKMTVDDPELVQGICKRLYPQIAEMFHVNLPCVERNIRSTLADVWNHTNCYAIADVLGYPVATVKRKLSNARFIAAATESLRMDTRVQAFLAQKDAESLK